MGMGGKIRFGENLGGLYKMIVWSGLLYAKIYSEKRIRDRKIKNKMGNKSQKI